MRAATRGLNRATRKHAGLTAAEQARMEDYAGPRRSMPGLSECHRSNCFSTSWTVKPAGPAPCRRRTPKGRELRRLKVDLLLLDPGARCSPDLTSRTRRTIFSQAFPVAGEFGRPPAEDLPAGGRGYEVTTGPPMWLTTVLSALS